MTSTSSIGTMFGAQDTDSFLGLPTCENLSTFDGKIALIGAPCATPYKAVGAYCAGGPKAIRAGLQGYSGNLHHMDFDLGGALFPNGIVTARDCGDLPWDENDPEANREQIRQAVRTVLDRQGVPVLIGGDDSIPIPMLEAYAGRGPITIVQIDAHIDWREEVGGESLGLSSTMRRASEMDHVERIIQVGQRAVGSARPGDYDDALNWGAQFVSAQAIHRDGIEPVLDLVPWGADVVIAFDCDALDPSVMPAVIGRAPGGLTYWQAIELMQGIAGKAKIAGADLVEFMPQRDIDEIGALTAARIVANMIGLIARQSS